MNSLSVPWKAWDGDDGCELTFPDSWDVQLCSMEDPPAITDVQIRNSLVHPIGSARIDVVARGLKSVAIAVDDITRPTPTRAILPAVLEQLSEAGIEKDKIKIIVASGAHGPSCDADLMRKFGERIVRHYKIVRT